MKNHKRKLKRKKKLSKVEKFNLWLESHIPRSPLYLVSNNNLSGFFTVPALMVLFMKYIEKKRS